MSRGVEIWLARTLQKLDSLLLGVCQDFQETSFLTVVDAYALIGDVSGLAEKIQNFFMQEFISETHAVLKSIVLGDLEASEIQSTRFTYNDLCTRIPESEFRKCLLATLSVLFKLMCSYHVIMSFHLEYKASMGQFSNEVQKQGDETGSSKNVQQGDDQRSSINGGSGIHRFVRLQTSEILDGGLGLLAYEYASNGIGVSAENQNLWAGLKNKMILM